MSTVFERAVAGPMSRILAKNKYRKVEHNEEDTMVFRDTEPQILDADDNNEIRAADSAGNKDAAEGHAAATDAPATTTLLGASGAVSHNGADTADFKAVKPKSKSLLGCLHFVGKPVEAHGGLPTAFNDRQSILRRLAKSAKKVTPPPVRPARPIKTSPYVLHAAAWRTNMDELQRLLASGGDVSKRDKAGLTCLHYAAWQGSVDAVQMLLDSGADITVKDPEGMLPLHFAAWFNRLDVAALLLDRGSQINPPSKGALWPTTPLIYAAKMGHVDMVSLLMDRGAQVAATYKSASSALHEAAWAGHTDVVAEMMRRSVSHDMATGRSKYRPLHLAAMSGSATVVEELLAKGAWVDARSQLGRTPLHLACEKGHIAAAAALVTGGADLLAKDRHGFTPLHLAVDNNHVQLAKLLLDKGATPDAADQHGALPLNFAHDPDFYKLLRAVRWYGAASVPSGNNPSSSRYVSDTPLAPEAEVATAVAAVTISQVPEAAASSGVAAPAAEVAVPATAGFTTTTGGHAAKVNKQKAQRQTPSSWIKAHMPYIRSHKSAVIAAASQPGSSTLEMPEQASVENVLSLTAAISAVEQALTGRVSPSSRVTALGGRINPADSHRSTRSTESATAQAAAASLARAAVEAVVARAAAEAALEEVAQEQKVRQASATKPVSPVPAAAGGGSAGAERNSADDARLLQQIRSALAAGSSGALPEAVTPAGAAMNPEGGEGKVALEEYMRPPASISIDAPADKTPGKKLAGRSSPGDIHVQNSILDQAAKHPTAADTLAATEASIPATLPISTKPPSDIAACAGADNGTSASKSPSGRKLGMNVSSKSASASAKGSSATGADGLRYAAPTVSAAAKKNSKSSKRKSHKTPGATTGYTKANDQQV